MENLNTQENKIVVAVVAAAEKAEQKPLHTTPDKHIEKAVLLPNIETK